MERISRTSNTVVILYTIMMLLVVFSALVFFLDLQYVRGLSMAFGAIGQFWVILMGIIVIADIYGAYPFLVFAMYVFHIVLLAVAISLSLYKWQKWRYTVRAILIQEVTLAALVEILLFREGIVLGAIVLNTMLLILYEVALRKRYPDMKFWGFKKKKGKTGNSSSS